MMQHHPDNPPVGAAPIATAASVTVRLDGNSHDVAAVITGLERLYEITVHRDTVATLAADTSPHSTAAVTLLIERGHPTPEGSEPTTGQRYDRRYLADTLRVLLNEGNNATPMPVTIPELVVLRRLVDLVAALYAGEELGQLARNLSARLRRRASGIGS